MKYKKGMNVTYRGISCTIFKIYINVVSLKHDDGFIHINKKSLDKELSK